MTGVQTCALPISGDRNGSVDFVNRNIRNTSPFDVYGWPTIYVLDAQGVIRFKDVRGEEIDEAVDQLLKELEAGE